MFDKGRGNNIYKRVLYIVFACVLGVAFPHHVSAHVVVRPSEVGVGAFQTFTVGVPNERDAIVTQIRLVVPEGFQHVTPNVKQGWRIETKKSEETVTEIIWSGGTIPVGQRDDFLFSAQAPGDPGEVQWHAFQVYDDGTTVSWNQDPNAEQPKDHEGNVDFSQVGPYSKTNVINDLVSEEELPASTGGSSAATLSWIAIALGGAALGMQLFGKKS